MQTTSVLVSIDVGTDHAHDALFAEAAYRAEAGGRLVVLTVVPEMYLSTSTDPKATITAMEEHARAQLEAVVSGSPISGAEIRVGYGPVAGVILDTATEIGADLIVLHARRPGPVSYALGSVASRVANHARASVIVIRD